MHLTVIDNIPFSPDADKMAERLKLGGMQSHEKEVKELVGLGARIGAPRACFAMYDVEKTGDATVFVAGQRFESRILRVNLHYSGKAVLFVATCGTQLEQWAESYEDMLLRWVAEELCEEALRTGVAALDQAVNPLLEGKHRISMNPGSLEDWPISEQKPLFSLFGDVERFIGVKLTDTFLMLPLKSVSGMFFQTEVKFQSCQLCPRERCPGRRAPYDEKLKEKYLSEP